jgi:hypothetical protein
VTKLRQIHLYLGCFFAPMLVLYAVTGIYQLLGLGHGRNASWLRYLSSIHTEHASSKLETLNPASPFLIIFIVLMALSLIFTIILGIIMAFKFGRGRLTFWCLAAGIVVPLALIVIFGH